MHVHSMSRLLVEGAAQEATFVAHRLLRARPRLDVDRLIGRMEGRSRTQGRAPAALSSKLNPLIGSARQPGTFKLHGRTARYAYDNRQRAIVKIHYFSHSGSGGASLRAHAKYVARDAAPLREPEVEREPNGPHPEAETDPHTRYLIQERKQARFYSASDEACDGGAIASRWSRTDRRHFRLILAPENGAALGDLTSYTREVMARAEKALGTKLEWIAVDHFDTDNPHTHVILRGVRDDGRDLIIPPDFVKHGWRSAARDVATEWLGERTRDQAREAVEREIRAHRPTRLDAEIAAQLPETGRVRLADFRSFNGDPNSANLLKARAQELRRLGLASEIRRNILQFEPNWRDGLKALELHLDVRKAMMVARAKKLKELQRSRLERQRGLGR